MTAKSGGSEFLGIRATDALGIAIIRRNLGLAKQATHGIDRHPILSKDKLNEVPA
jgi:hypothetical protein